MAPVRLLCESARCWSAVSLATSGGTEPEKRLPWRKRERRSGREKRSPGTSPKRRLDRRESTRRPRSAPRVPCGTRPMRPTPGRRSATTVALAASQVTPTQAQAGVEAFQASARSCGVPARKARRAERSCCGGSATAQQATASARSRRRSAAMGMGQCRSRSHGWEYEEGVLVLFMLGIGNGNGNGNWRIVPCRARWDTSCFRPYRLK
ncbi:Os05g0588225 [Oryza sativa Japonica Group]|uniref:Os05g0588225 protein n=1 Tax=Oryza sativa subsp. japonica TaxID=39947 RepID=A0A0P0WRG7_ORYSJ|nr:Os05g0588225 [Oryza sativa Japonica Group]